MVRVSSVGVGDGGVGGVGGSDNIVTIKSFLPPTHGNALLRWAPMVGGGALVGVSDHWSPTKKKHQGFAGEVFF